jgi:hypothetical protein
MAKGQHWQIARFDFEGCDFHVQKGIDVSFLMPLESLHFNL